LPIASELSIATWSKKTFAPGRVHEWEAVQDAFEKLYTAMFPSHWSPGRRGEMMLLHTDTEDGGDVLYMALPNGVTTTFDGFQPTTFNGIPPKPNLLVADQIGYDELFRR
jgi:hypothetical protein